MVDSWGGWVSKLSTSSKLRNGNIGSLGGGGWAHSINEV